MTKRDEFRKKTKDILAHRVAWICSWPGCPTVTVGPNKSSTDSFQILGEAAHIHAAAKGGPRYDPNISQEERKSISNGIWLCRQHARLIDNDYKEYSPETLRKWKLSAENAAYKALCLPGDQYLRDTTTLIQIGNDIVFHGKWISADEDKREWSVLVDDYVYGNEFLLKDYCSKYNDRNDKYIVIQDQGDGRIIRVAPSWQLKDTKMYLTVNIEDKFVRTNPYDAGVDLALSPSWDITLDANGDFDLVRGILIPQNKEFLRVLVHDMVSCYFNLVQVLFSINIFWIIMKMRACSLLY